MIPGLLNAIRRMKIQSLYEELCILLYIFQSLSVSGGEQAFSKIKIIKTTCALTCPGRG